MKSTAIPAGRPSKLFATRPDLNWPSLGPTRGHVPIWQSQRVVPEAELVTTENGLVPKGQGWFVVNAREAQWWERPGLSVLCEFEGAGLEGATDFEQLGINVTVLGPGEPMSMYPRGTNKRAFFSLDGG